MITYKQASTEEELQQILHLQAKNLKAVITPSERETDGFLTVAHSLSLLKEMNDESSHIIAVDNGVVVGYALCMHPKFADCIEILRPMYEEINKTIGKKRNYMVMGQICVAKSHRGKGLFRKLYETMQVHLPNGTDTIITEVDGENKRSLEAHLSIGFKTLKVYQSLGRNWHLIYLQ